VKNHTLDREIVLGIGSLDLGNGQVSELLCEDRNQDRSHLSERLLNDKEIRSSLLIEGEIGTELGKLVLEVLTRSIVLDVVENKSKGVEDVSEERFVLALEEISSLIEELRSISNLRIIVESLRVLKASHGVLSELLKVASSLRIALEFIDENPDSAFELVESSNTREFLQDELSLLPELVVLLSRKI